MGEASTIAPPLSQEKPILSPIGFEMLADECTIFLMRSVPALA
jgi:hypothetical protein